MECDSNLFGGFILFSFYEARIAQLFRVKVVYKEMFEID